MFGVIGLRNALQTGVGDPVGIVGRDLGQYLNERHDSPALENDAVMIIACPPDGSSD